MLVHNSRVVLFTESDPHGLPKRLVVFHSEAGGDAVPLHADVELHYETVLVGGPDPFAACAFPSAT